MAGRKADLVILSREDRSFLEAQARRHKAPRSLSDRCRMVLLCADGLQSKENTPSANGGGGLRRLASKD